MKFAGMLFLVLLIGCQRSDPEGPRRERNPVAKTPMEKVEPPAAQSPISDTGPKPSDSGAPNPWALHTRGVEVRLERAECVVRIRLGRSGESMSVRGNCPPERAPTIDDLKGAVGALLKANPSARGSLKKMGTGPIGQFDDGRWGRTLSNAAAKDLRWKTRGERRSGDPTQNAVYVSLVRASGAMNPLREVVGAHGFEMGISAVEKVFVRPLKGAERGRALPYDAGMHTFVLTPSTP